MVYLGVDIGVAAVAFRAEFDDGRIEQTCVEWPPGQDVAADAAALADGLARFRAGWAEPLGGVGVGVLTGTGIRSWPPRPHWTGFDLGGLLAGLFPGVRTRWLGHGELAAVAEAERFDVPDLAYLGVGAGVTGGVVLDGRPLSEVRGTACDLGHVIVERYGPPCGCGRQGCLEAVASGPATLKRASRRRGGAVSADELKSAFAGDEMWAVSAVGESAMAIATALISLSELLHPPVVVIGGGFREVIESFAGLVADYTRQLARPGHAVPSVRAAAPGAPALRGAVLLAKG